MRLNLPNTLTMIRIFISPLFLFFYVQYEAMGIPYTVLPYILLFLLGASELSDTFDGYLARKYTQVTDLGKILDPMADTIFHMSIFMTFTTGVVQLPMGLVFIFFYRDMMISTLRTMCALRGFALAARTSGKLKAIVQALTCLVIVLAMIPHSLGMIDTDQLQWISRQTALVAAVYTIYSGIDYMIANRGHIYKILQG
jgi:CDP-diacylglycerol--glycerol-3-phosphate 3-phosphatidyltransferase